MTYGTSAYDGVLCDGTTGSYITQGGWTAPSMSYPVDRLEEIVSTAHPEGLLPAPKPSLQRWPGGTVEGDLDRVQSPSPKNA